MGTYQEIVRDLRATSSKQKKYVLQRFFKTGKGEYAEGDQFHGIVVPDQRKVAQHHTASTDKQTIIELLDSRYHEERLTGLFILCNKFNADRKNGMEKKWVDLYLKKADRVNNWDLVDSSAHIILGQWLEDKDRSILYQLAHDTSLWKNRIAVVATWHFIRKQHDLTDILELSKIMMHHPHDLMHKATGWMLREGWKEDAQQIERFLDQFASSMPRTMLRYAIERMKEQKRKSYLIKK